LNSKQTFLNLINKINLLLLFLLDSKFLRWLAKTPLRYTHLRSTKGHILLWADQLNSLQTLRTRCTQIENSYFQLWDAIIPTKSTLTKDLLWAFKFWSRLSEKDHSFWMIWNSSHSMKDLELHQSEVISLLTVCPRILRASLKSVQVCETGWWWRSRIWIQVKGLASWEKVQNLLIFVCILHRSVQRLTDRQIKSTLRTSSLSLDEPSNHEQSQILYQYNIAHLDILPILKVWILSWFLHEFYQ